MPKFPTNMMLQNQKSFLGAGLLQAIISSSECEFIFVINPPGCGFIQGAQLLWVWILHDRG